MGHREYFVYTTKGDKIENLFESISKKIKLNSDNIEEPTIIIYCKAEVLKNFSNGIDGLEKGTVGAVISPEDITIDELMDVKTAVSEAVTNSIEHGYDGIIHIKSAFCTPEIGAMPIISKIAEEKDVPVLFLTFDANTSEIGVKTRLEAFYDMLEMRKKR